MNVTKWACLVAPNWLRASNCIAPQGPPYYIHLVGVGAGVPRIETAWFTNDMHSPSTFVQEPGRRTKRQEFSAIASYYPLVRGELLHAKQVLNDWP